MSFAEDVAGSYPPFTVLLLARSLSSCPASTRLHLAPVSIVFLKRSKADFVTVSGAYSSVSEKSTGSKQKYKRING